jgi:AAA ATPase domain
LAALAFWYWKPFATPGGASAFGPLVEVLRAYHRSTGGPFIDGPLAAHLALLLPELGPAEREGDSATLFEAIRLALATIAAQQPTALFLDDLQWADDATIELLPALARTLPEQPMLILAAYRSDELPRAHPIRRMRGELKNRPVGWRSGTHSSVDDSNQAPQVDGPTLGRGPGHASCGCRALGAWPRA